MPTHTQSAPNRSISGDIEINASLQEAWEAWSTPAGVKSFFAPDCRLELRIGGPFEMLFDLEAEKGTQGSEGAVILAFQEPSFLSFTWNSPPHLPTVRDQKTHCQVRLVSLGPKKTLVSFYQDGWGTGGEWDESLKYFERAWLKMVLPRLKYRFEHGPLDWDNLPRL